MDDGPLVGGEFFDAAFECMQHAVVGPAVGLRFCQALDEFVGKDQAPITPISIELVHHLIAGNSEGPGGEVRVDVKTPPLLPKHGVGVLEDIGDVGISRHQGVDECTELVLMSNHVLDVSLKIRGFLLSESHTSLGKSFEKSKRYEKAGVNSPWVSIWPGKEKADLPCRRPAGNEGPRPYD